MNLGVDQADVDDLAQKVLLVLWKNLPDFDYTPKKCKFRTWMNTIIRNTCKNYFRNELRYKNRANKTVETKGEAIELPDIYAIAEEKWKEHIVTLAWENLKNDLSDKYQQCYTLLLEGISTEQIAQALEMKLNSAYVMRLRLIEKLHREIRRLDEELS